MMRAQVLKLIAAAVALALLMYAVGAVSFARPATPTPAPPAVIASEVLGLATPYAVENPELALGRVTIMPGAAIPVHHHPGTQIGAVVQGTLTYTVLTGTVEWLRAADAQSEPFAIRPGETVLVPTGDTLIEAPGSIHQGRNEGNVPVVIYLSTLFPAGAPRAIVDPATPVP